MAATLVGAVPKKKDSPTPFGARLTTLRRARGMTQVQLAEAIGSSQRAISHYESAAGHPPTQVLIELSKALQVSTDTLLGLDKDTERTNAFEENPKARQLLKKLEKLLTLPEKDQRAVIRLLNSLAARAPTQSARPSRRRAES